ncbi:MAG: TIGR00159 family protein [Lentisphaerae bacterium GWF2_45_14]|nr:MAG: TIGR00159 family protein [Lentisphaerae bacterium GWF2_45_14]
MNQELIQLYLQNSMTYIRPVLEIGLLTLLIYNTLYFMRGTRGASVLAGIIIILILLTSASDSLKFEVISWLLENLWAMLATALIVIFQPELRRAFAQLGSAAPWVYHSSKKKEAITEVVTALINMSRQRTGSLIVFERQIGMATIVNSAVPLDSRINSSLIESIFFPNSPLHDGAVIIKNNRIIAAHAILPLPHDETQISGIGTRHRAAIGITEETDAVAVVVSEETGIVSIACRGRLKRNIKHDKLLRFLSSLLVADEDGSSLKNIFGTMEENDEMTKSFDSGEDKI